MKKVRYVVISVCVFSILANMCGCGKKSDETGKTDEKYEISIEADDFSKTDEYIFVERTDGEQMD